MKKLLICLFLLLFVPFFADGTDWSRVSYDKTYREALEYCSNLEENGYSWQLPTTEELSYLSLTTGEYWAKDSWVRDPNKACFFNFKTKSKDCDYENKPINVICIRKITKNEQRLKSKADHAESEIYEANKNLARANAKTYQAEEERKRAEEYRKQAEVRALNEAEGRREAEKKQAAMKSVYEEEKNDWQKYVKKHDLEHPYKIPGISLIVVGAVVAAGGVAGFHFAAENKYDEYKKMARLDKAQDAVDNGTSKESYMKSARNLRKEANTFRALEITSGAVGGAVLVTGIVLVAITAPKNFAITNISVEPSKNGFYASLGFDF